MSPPSRVAAVALLLIGMILLASVSVASPQMGTLAQDDPDGFGDDPEVSFAAELEADGDARWNITTTVALNSASDVEAYRSTARDFEDGELPPLGYSAFETGMTDVNSRTDREMTLSDFRRETSTESEIENGVGRFTVEFTWENFMRQSDSRLMIDREVLVMDDGNLWFPGLSDSQTLSITAPPDYGVRDSSVGAQNGELRWEGPETFDETSLKATFLGGGGDPDGNDTNDDRLPDRSGVFPWLLLPIVAIGIAIALFLTRTDQIQLDLPTDLDVREMLSSGAASGTAEQETSSNEPATTGGQTADEGGNGEGINTELLSDEERVERLLSSNGGRMKQADIVKETDWSNAKVSQLLSSMEEEGQIDKLRIGRENLISFPDEDIADSEE